MNKQEKELNVSDLSKKLQKAKAVILAEYRGLKVSEITEVRKELRKNAGEMTVIKNRLAKRAVLASGMEGLQIHLKGPLAMTICEQEVVVISKILSKFSENHSALKLKVAFLDGQILDAKGIQALAKLPSKEELYAKLLGTLLLPAQGVVRTLQGVSRKLAIALKAISEKK